MKLCTKCKQIAPIPVFDLCFRCQSPDMPFTPMAVKVTEVPKNTSQRLSKKSANKNSTPSFSINRPPLPPANNKLKASSTFKKHSKTIKGKQRIRINSSEYLLAQAEKE
jgi:hypothetical protein